MEYLVSYQRRGSTSRVCASTPSVSTAWQVYDEAKILLARTGGGWVALYADMAMLAETIVYELDTAEVQP